MTFEQMHLYQDFPKVHAMEAEQTDSFEDELAFFGATLVEHGVLVAWTSPPANLTKVARQLILEPPGEFAAKIFIDFGKTRIHARSTRCMRSGAYRTVSFASIAHRRCHRVENTIPNLVWAAAKRYGDATAIEDVGENGTIALSFRELADAGLNATRAFMSQGIEPGDRVAIWAPNLYEWIVAAIGLQGAGAVLVEPARISALA